MMEGTATLMAMFYAPWLPPRTLPETVVTRKHRLLSDSKAEPKDPVHARTRIMAALDEFEWKTVEQLARETTLTVNTVAVTTDRMRRSGKIDRSKKVTPFGKVNVYRKK
jgi:hypothetical protein